MVRLDSSRTSLYVQLTSSYVRLDQKNLRHDQPRIAPRAAFEPIQTTRKAGLDPEKTRDDVITRQTSTTASLWSIRESAARRKSIFGHCNLCTNLLFTPHSLPYRPRWGEVCIGKRAHSLLCPSPDNNGFRIFYCAFDGAQDPLDYF